jgi:hypothetical protein
MAKSVFPDIRHVDPRREVIDAKTIVFDDLTNAFIAVNNATTRFEEEMDSRFGMLLNRRVDELEDALKLYKRRVNDIRKEINMEIKRQKQNGSL